MATKRESIESELPGSESTGASDGPLFRFGRLFSKRDVPDDSDDDLCELGRAMHEGPDLGVHPTSPGGVPVPGPVHYTDLSWDKSGTVSDKTVSPKTILQARTPLFDLDRLYGAGRIASGIWSRSSTEATSTVSALGKQRPRLPTKQIEPTTTICHETQITPTTAERRLF